MNNGHISSNNALQFVVTQGCLWQGILFQIQPPVLIILEVLEKEELEKEERAKQLFFSAPTV